MERFRLRVLNQQKKGLIWELKLFPDHPGYAFNEKDGRIMGSSSVPSTILWLRQLSGPYLKNAVAPAPIDAEKFGPESEPRWLQWEDGLRLSMAFSNARYLTTARQRKMFKEGLHALPSEVVLYWFTLCFYGYRQPAGRAALRILLTYEQTADDKQNTARKKIRPIAREESNHKPLKLFPTVEDIKPGTDVGELAKYYSGEKAKDKSRGKSKSGKPKKN